MELRSQLQPTFFDAFKCIGAACEDTCCDGWQIAVDKATYERYGSCSSQAWSKPLQQFVTINPFSASDNDYAVIDLAGSRCQLLSDGLCSVQSTLGEQYLPKTCATYPRVRNTVGTVAERSLDLSCPEAARLTLLDPAPISFTSAIATGSGASTLDISYVSGAADPIQAFRDIRQLFIAVLQNRSRPLWHRLITLGYLCQRLEEELSQPYLVDRTIQQLRAEAYDCQSGSIELTQSRAQSSPADQIAVLVELIICRIGSDFTNQRFLECYAEFVSGLRWTMQSSMDDLGAQYTESYTRYYAPFMSHHGHMMEHYMVSYVYKSLFPFGSELLNRKFRENNFDNTIGNHYRLMTANYAIMKTILIGMAALHKEALSPAHVIKLMQSCVKTFEHSMTYPGRLINLLTSKGINTPSDMAAIVENFGELRFMTAAP